MEPVDEPVIVSERLPLDQSFLEPEYESVAIPNCEPVLVAYGIT